AAPSDKQARSPVAAEADDDKPGQPAAGNKARRGTAPATGSTPSTGATVEVEIFADSSSKNGDISIHQGYVNATWANTRLQADSVSYNEVTGDMVAEGNVIYDEGPEQRITARRAELNVASHRGTFWNTTGFTDRTATGEFLYYSADRVVKTGSTTYELYNATVTACEDIVPKWSFHSKRAELKVDDRVRLYDAVFLVRGIPAIPFPFAWLPATKTERKSGFLIPSTTNSNQKGRVLNEAYFQTLGPSADLTIRTDIYSQRGIGLGAQFRAQTSDNSYVRVGVFNVQDRLFGTAGPNQGGTSLVATGVQYLPGGWIAAGNVSLVTSLDFRQVFSDDIRQVIDPRQQSQGYVENNTGSFSFSALASDEITTLFTPGSVPSTGTTEDVKVRQLPEVELNQFSRQVFRNLPIYFSFDSTFGSLSRREVVDDVNVLATPAVQRFDLQPRVTISLPSLGGIAITPSFSFRETFYSNSIKPNATLFDPNSFAVSSTDPRLNPTDPSFVPGLRLFDPVTMNPLSSNSLSRHYGEFSLDIRPPAFEKDYLDPDGSQRFRHVIEPYVTYRVITGIGPEFNQIIRFDDRDAVANTNQIEYAVVNRFFITRPASEILRRRKRAPRVDEMTPERPEVDDSTEPANPQGGKASPKSARTESAPDGGQQEPVAGQVPAQQASGQEPSGQQSPAGSGKQTVGQETGEQESSGQQTTGQEGNSGKTNQLETGESSDLRKAGIQTQRTGARRRGGRPGSNPDEDTPGA
ncbi:MAG TPA: LPS assembly protein LptD, partial [Blastocatellia bacterium]|nr:LPS assembly protein LptD [Blastocatellia bacterium]